MKKKTIGIITVAAVVLICAVVTGIVFLNKNNNTDPSAITEGYGEKKADIIIGDTYISDYLIFNASGKQGEESASLLKDYVAKVTATELPIAKRDNSSDHSIKLEIVKADQDSYNEISIKEGNITLRGRSEEELKETVKIFANTYLGYAFAGEDREFFTEEKDNSEGTNAIYLPSDVYEPEGEAWIAQREPIICLWKTTTARGAYYNPNTNPNSELMDYTDAQLYTYVRMMKRLGYNGIQVTEMCSAWAGSGSYEYVHERLRFMADAAHSMGMKFTLWVWGAEFNGYGWGDKTVDYYDHWKYANASENPKALATFEKYYDIYAELADCSDRVIMHFDDPGNLINNEDVAFFSKMFKEKCLEKNPNIDFGVSCYKNNRDPLMLNEIIGEGTTYYSGASQKLERDDEWTGFRQRCSDLGYEYGVWSWNLTEMEIDQLAEMNVNSALIANVYRNSLADDPYGKPSYWSEMDSYHVLNVFSHYVAAGLLQDPLRDENELLKESAEAVVGAEYADRMLEVLKLIEKARTGDSMKVFRSGYDEYLLLSDEYPADEILSDSEKALEYIDEMIEADIKCNTIPLPVSVTEVLKMMRPHILQINKFAEFRHDLAELEQSADGYSKEELQTRINEMYEPVPEYDVITGLWGQPEARAQFMLLSDFCKEYDLEIPRDEEFTQLRKDRVLSEYIAFQKESYDPVYREKNTGFQLGVAFGEEETAYITQLLIDEGLLSENEEGLVYLTDWEKY
jgi:hypothetical protein